MDKQWYLEVWTVPPDGCRYQDAHPEHRAKIAAMTDAERERYGITESHPLFCNTVESIGQVVHKTYKTEAGAKRAAERYRSNPALFVEINPGFSLSF